MNSRVVEAPISVEDDEHPLVELRKELLQGLLEVDVALLVVVLQVLEEVDEDVRVALVDDAVRLREEVVELQLRRGQQVDEMFRRQKRNNLFLGIS